ncbi:aspartyl-tRNA(Asn)/glutamyl-tRNA(Gln) amidotransferase subunit C [Desulfobaculum xiamenense]|uniref:Aspartyl/glutamyl-tRNA(Asn/Gln) amidotransferase subunit C n=1 Tax=Desulfobaculum xiamenense TaxID=995050 RepID=A0A846QMU1_9BACT|nr:Asp-tRNA(Asn)/Glu-tRNA(Gln) amidotransferase subunit GatC [Desulfobaculum xiamenense]NJB69448.1 aspartyl-tRNA(Asn)/glutamyl-tRNA(Gln) amidotransferase subunit C [Desulfobaculum xiamenense]
MKFSPEQVAGVAKLARLRLDEDELSRFAAQIGDILEYMDELGQAETEGVEPLYSPVEHVTRLREDEVHRDCEREDVLDGAPDTDGKYFIVPRIV